MARKQADSLESLAYVVIFYLDNTIAQYHVFANLACIKPRRPGRKPVVLRARNLSSPRPLMRATQSSSMYDGKSIDKVIQDHEILGGKDSSSDRTAEDLTKFSDEERDLEKKLLRKIDLLIMPLIVVIYLMNFIDR